jgi:hypothetical protein
LEPYLSTSSGITLDGPMSQVVVQCVTQAFIHAEKPGKAPNKLLYAGRSHCGNSPTKMRLLTLCTSVEGRRMVSWLMSEIRFANVRAFAVASAGPSPRLLLSVATTESAKRWKRRRSNGE